MPKSSIRFFSIAAVLSLISSVSMSADIDKRLVGDWQGQRDPSGRCSFLAWEMSRHSDGRFEITFYEDSNKTKIANRESGTWWVKANVFYTQTKGVPTPDGYSYAFQNQDTVRFTVLKRDLSADCEADYEFIDARVRSN